MVVINLLRDVFSGSFGNSLRDVFSGSFGNSLRDVISGGLGKSFDDIPVSSNLTAVYTGNKLRDLQTWTDLWCTGNERNATGIRISLKVIMFQKEDSSVLGYDAEPLSKKNYRIFEGQYCLRYQSQAVQNEWDFLELPNTENKGNTIFFENSVIFSQRLGIILHKIAVRNSKLGEHRNIGGKEVASCRAFLVYENILYVGLRRQ
jgi:hypothetical protein